MAGLEGKGSIYIPSSPRPQRPLSLAPRPELNSLLIENILECKEESGREDALGDLGSDACHDQR